jgi:hypothetical protein
VGLDINRCTPRQHNIPGAHIAGEHSWHVVGAHLRQSQAAQSSHCNHKKRCQGLTHLKGDCEGLGSPCRHQRAYHLGGVAKLQFQFAG